jgi:hypothetical protein
LQARRFAADAADATDAVPRRMFDEYPDGYDAER